MKQMLLIVDDDEEIRVQLKWALSGEYQVVLAEDRASALEKYRSERPDCVLLDLGLPPSPGDPREGFQTLRQIKELNSHAKIIVATGQSEKRNALDSVEQGAYDFLSKPVDIDELKLILKRAYYLSGIEQDLRAAKNAETQGGFEGILGDSEPMQKVFTFIRKVSKSDIPVLVLGESGTGKEMVAKAIHRQSDRKEGPFVAINCGAIPSELLESELFGHEKGAFTGAQTAKKGRFESATGGILFLDEVGELPPPLQVKLLRFLQEKTITRLGGNKELDVDARIIAATNMDLEKSKSEGNFREDLFFRLAVVVIKLPPLRERHGDAALIAKYVMRRTVDEVHSKAAKFSTKALQAIETYAWPGNVRELENKVRRAIIMTEGKQITPEDLELDPFEIGKTTDLSLKVGRDHSDTRLIRQALAISNGNLSNAAKLLHISRPALYDLIDKLDLKTK